MTVKLDKKEERFRLLIIEARKDAQMSQSDVADKLGKPQSYVSKIERGERKITVIEFLELAKAMKVNPADLINKINSGKT